LRQTVLPAVPSSEVYLEDCVKALKRYADNHFDLAIVDPPYGIRFRFKIWVTTTPSSKDVHAKRFQRIGNCEAELG
jgi:DNA modification methylase